MYEPHVFCQYHESSCLFSVHLVATFIHRWDLWRIRFLSCNEQEETILPKRHQIHSSHLIVALKGCIKSNPLQQAPAPRFWVLPNIWDCPCCPPLTVRIKPHGTSMSNTSGIKGIDLFLIGVIFHLKHSETAFSRSSWNHLKPVKRNIGTCFSSSCRSCLHKIHINRKVLPHHPWLHLGLRLQCKTHKFKSRR